MESSKKTRSFIVGSAAIAAIVGIGGVVYTSSARNSTDTTSGVQGLSQTTNSAQNTSAPTQTATEAPVQSTVSSFKNGSYSATKKYRVPDGQNSIKVTVTIVDGNLTAVKTVNDYGNEESAYYVDSFEANISDAVKGDKITEAYAGRVGGASLTSSAFNDALQTIINDAKV